ncbi:TFIIIC transcription initiation factor complex subunits Tfc3 [Diplocarpon rosae]|nr:TFIIIC transcription initiation factor complex subunits Tfc3 [Diplocarpon rosae]
MAANLESVMADVLDVLRKAAAEGISISQLFEKLGPVLSDDSDLKSRVWGHLVTRDDVVVVEQKLLHLSESPLKELALSDLWESGSGEKKIRILEKSSSTPPAEEVVTSIESDDIQSTVPDPETPNSGRPRRIARTKSSTQKPALKVPKRRGRPPKSRPEEFVSDANQDLPSFTPPVWESGEPGVYIDPPGSQRCHDGPEIGDDSCIAVFRSSKLMDAERLEKGKGTWQTHVLLAVAKAKLALADKAAENFTKNGKPRRRSYNKKKPMVAKDPEPGDESNSEGEKEGDADENANHSDHSEEAENEPEAALSRAASKSAFDTAQMYGNQFGSKPPSPPVKRGALKKGKTAKRGKEVVHVHWAPATVSQDPWGWATSWTKEKAIEDEEYEAMLREQSYTPEPWTPEPEAPVSFHQDGPRQDADAEKHTPSTKEVAEPEDQFLVGKSTLETPANATQSAKGVDPTAETSRTATPSAQPATNHLAPNLPASMLPIGAYKSIYSPTLGPASGTTPLGVVPRCLSFASTNPQQDPAHNDAPAFQSSPSLTNPQDVHAVGDFAASTSALRSASLGVSQIIYNLNPAGYKSPYKSPYSNPILNFGNDQLGAESQAAPEEASTDSVTVTGRPIGLERASHTPSAHQLDSITVKASHGSQIIQENPLFDEAGRDTPTCAEQSEISILASSNPRYSDGQDVRATVSPTTSTGSKKSRGGAKGRSRGGGTIVRKRPGGKHSIEQAILVAKALEAQRSASPAEDTAAGDEAPSPRKGASENVRGSSRSRGRGAPRTASSGRGRSGLRRSASINYTEIPIDYDNPVDASLEEAQEGPEASSTVAGGDTRISPDTVMADAPIASMSPSVNPIIAASSVTSEGQASQDAGVSEDPVQSAHGIPSRSTETPSTPAPSSSTMPSNSTNRKKRKHSEAADGVEPDDNLEPPTKKPRSKAALKKIEQENFKATMAEAEAVTFPDGMTQFPCSFEGTIGNLLLSADKKKLEFFALNRDAPHLPVLNLEVSKIIGNPILSMKGSNPMELRIKQLHADSTDVTHRFIYAPTITGNAAAANMRTMIVTAALIHTIEGGDYETVQETKFANEKPFQCTTCKGRFKNPGGLEYHVKKSRTSCNPNFDPATDIDKRLLRVSKSGKPKGAPRTPRKKSVQRKPTADEEEDDLEIVLEDDVEPQVSSDAESIVEWWEKNNTAPVEAPQVVGKPAKRYMALSREGDIAREIIGQLLPEVSDTEAPRTADNGEAAQFEAPIKLDLVTAADVARNMKCSTLSSAWYEEAVVALVESNGKVFSGERGVWFACVSVWLKQHPVTDVLPESKLCAKAVDDLVYAKVLSSIEFSFTGKKSRVITRRIITSPGIAGDNPRVELIKTMVEEYNPEFYVPSQFAPSQPILEKLQAVASRSLPSMPAVETAVDDEPGSSSADSPPSFTEQDEEDSGDSDEYEADMNAAADDEDDAEDFADEDAEDEGMVSFRTPGKRRRSSMSATPHSRRRNPGHNAKIAAGVRRHLDKVRSGLVKNKYPWEFKQKPGPVTQEQMEAREAAKKQFDMDQAAKRAWKLQCWDQIPSFMPNTSTGAWDQGGPPIVPKERARTTGAGKRQSRSFRRQPLPEPITFMQAMNGAWSVRPFGHGVNPIYSRPARRAEGNPNLQAYLNRVQNGHRPIIYPPIENRMHFPQPPSAVLMKALKEGKPISEETGLPINSRKRGAYSHKNRERQGAAVTPDSDHEYDEDDFAENSDDYELNPPKRPKTIDALSGQGMKRPRASRQRALSSSAVELEDLSDAPVRLSKATGKPVRVYNRRFPQQVFVKSAGTIGDVLEPSGSRFVQRNGPKRLKGLTEVDILNYYEPKKQGPEAPLNPGLDTIPVGFGFSELDNSYPLKFTEFVDPEVVAEGKDPFFGSWTVDRMDSSVTDDYSVRWDEATAFTIYTIPYSQLEDDSVRLASMNFDDDVEDETRPKTKRQCTGNSKQPLTFHNGPNKGKKYRYARLQTALPSDLLDIFDDPAKATDLFGVEIGIPNEMTLKRARNHGSNVMHPETENRFVIGVSAIRILTGGLDEQVDWVIVASLFPQYSLNFLAKSWKQLLLRKKPAIDQLEADFREAFLDAYQSGDIPPLDYNHLVEYPWDRLIDWIIENVDSSLSNKEIPLPGSKSELSSAYNMLPISNNNKKDVDDVTWRESYYHPSMAVYKRFELSASEAHALPVGRKARVYGDLDDATVVRSWVRATAATPESHWDPVLAKQKMDTFPHEYLSEAIAHSIEKKTIRRRKALKANNGRVYALHDTWSGKLRRHIKDPQFAEAVTFKRWLDAQFRAGLPCVQADYFANEGALMVLTSLQAHGRVKFVPVNVPKKKFGLGDGGYETKKIPREAYLWDIDIYPSPTYLYDEENPVLTSFAEGGPPRGGASGEIPIWFSIQQRPIPAVWNRLLTGVAQVVALRAGIDTEALKKAFKDVLEDWEWRLLFEWGVETGVWRNVGMGGVDAWSAGEWWWGVVGAGVVEAGEDAEALGDAGVDEENVDLGDEAEGDEATGGI